MKAIDLVTPNRFSSIGKSPYTIMVVGQIVFALILWTMWSNPLVPKPIEVLRAFPKIAANGLLQDITASLVLCMWATLLTTIISLAVSYLYVIPFFRPLGIIISKGRFLGLTGLVFLFMVLTGSGYALKLSLQTFGMSVFFVTSMVSILNEIPNSEYEYARTLRFNEWRVWLEVVILARRDKAIETLRQIFAIGWTMLTMVEGIARSDGGIGVMLLNSNKQMQLDVVFALQIVILLLGLFADYVITLLNKVLSYYAFLETEKK